MADIPALPEVGSTGWGPIISEALTDINDEQETGRLSESALSDTYVPRWAAATAYATGAKVVSPNGDIVSAIAAFTSGASYDTTKWNLSPTFAASVAPKANYRSALPVYVVDPYYGGTFGQGDDTACIQATVKAASDAGGGRVVVPFTGSYVPLASQIVLPKWVHFSGSSWNSFGASGNVGRLQQLSGVNDDFIVFSDNGDVTTARPFIGPQSITDLVLRAASGSSKGHGIAFRVPYNPAMPSYPTGRTALIQDFSTFQRLNLRGFAGSGMFIQGGSPIIIEDVATLWNGGYGIELIDPHVDLNNYSLHHTVLHKISGDGNMGYVSDAGGATIYVKGQVKWYALDLEDIKSEYRIRPSSDSGDGIVMGNAHAIILEDVESQVSIRGVTHISTGSQPRKPGSTIKLIGTLRPHSMEWSAIGIRGDSPGQTGTDIFTVVEDAVDGVNYTMGTGSLGVDVEADAPGLTSGESTLDRRSITSTGATISSGLVRLTYFQAQKSEVITKVRTLSGTTAAVGATLARIGVYEEDPATGDLTLVASTANDTALWTSTSTSYGKTFTSSFKTKRGTRYAVAALVVGASTAPNLLGTTQLLAAEAGLPPRLCGNSASGQTDLPSTILASTITDTSIQVYAALVP